jgi:outer membrane receptor protein involved in Fe transport
MRTFPRSRSGLAVAALLSMIGSALPAVADTPNASAHSVVGQAAATTTASLTGAVKDGSGAAVVGARVTLSGPTKLSTTTDSKGDFTIAAPPGIYSIEIERGGYNPVSLSDITIAAGTSTPVSVVMNQASLNSLRTIGQVTSTANGNQINTGPATQTYLPAQAFADLPNAQINAVLEHDPDVTVQHMGSQPDTTIIVGAVQPYETQVLIDGHPIATGQNGAWSSQYFPSYLIGGLETQSGPGNTTPFANLAVGGTANIITPSFTKATTAELNYGVDNYASQQTNFLGTGSLGNLEYVVDLGSAGVNNPLTGTNQCLISPQANNTGIITNCLSGDGNFFNKAMLGKLKYDFTPTTSLEVGFVGTYGGYNPQGSAWATAYGQTQVVACNGSVTQPECTNPADAYLIGKNINAYSWYTGSQIYTSQQLYDAEFRTSVGNTTILIRPYLADIAPENTIQTPGAGQNSYTEFYGPAGSGQFPSGTPVTVNANGTLTGDGVTVTPNAAETTCTSSFYNITNPQGKYITAGNDQFACYGSIFTTYEQDKLYGATTSIIQPIGDSLLNFTYDFHGSSTIANIFDPSEQPSVPFTAERYSTFSLTGDLNVIPKLGINFGLYDTTWTVSGTTPELDATGNPVAGPDFGYVLQALGRSVTKFDPKIAFVYHPNSNLAVRLATGGAATFPFPGQLSGIPTYQSPAISLGVPFAGGGTLIEKNPNLNPETSWAYSGGVDYRFSNKSLLSLDGVQTIVHGVFEQLTSVVDRPDLPDYPPAGPVALEGVFFPFNAANLNSKSLILKYTYAPAVGFGFNVKAAANSVIVSGLTPNLYSPGSASLPAPGVQICGNGTTAPGIATCIPYLQGYGQFTYAFKDGAFAALGTQYFGKNNSYFSPPFAQVDLLARKPITKNLELQFSIENLLNTNTYGLYKPINAAGEPLVAATTNSTFTTVSQVTYPPTALIPADPRTVRLNLRIHFNR